MIPLIAIAKTMAAESSIKVKPRRNEFLMEEVEVGVFIGSEPKHGF